MKTNKLGRLATPLIIPEFHPNQQIFPLHTLMAGSEEQLFISFVKPHEAVSSNTICRWITPVLTDAGIDNYVFTGPSTRAASTSTTRMKEVPVDVLMAIRWLAFGQE